MANVGSVILQGILKGVTGHLQDKVSQQKKARDEQQQLNQALREEKAKSEQAMALRKANRPALLAEKEEDEISEERRAQDKVDRFIKSLKDGGHTTTPEEEKQLRYRAAKFNMENPELAAAIALGDIPKAEKMAKTVKDAQTVIQMKKMYDSHQKANQPQRVLGDKGWMWAQTPSDLKPGENRPMGITPPAKKGKSGGGSPKAPDPYKQTQQQIKLTDIQAKAAKELLGVPPTMAKFISPQQWVDSLPEGERQKKQALLDKYLGLVTAKSDIAASGLNPPAPSGGKAPPASEKPSAPKTTKKKYDASEF